MNAVGTRRVAKGKLLHLAVPSRKEAFLFLMDKMRNLAAHAQYLRPMLSSKPELRFKTAAVVALTKSLSVPN